MCGIAGWVGRPTLGADFFEEKLQRLRKVMELQSYRGPDASGIWENQSKNIIFGHNRLSILELSDAGAQPMIDPSSNSVLSYNGELYNHNSLRKELVEKFSVNFRGKSDTEVVLHGIQNFGIDEFLRKADGMFAFAFFDQSSEEIILARDRVGEKPLYFFNSSSGFCFASELKALTAIFDHNLVIDDTGLQLYLLLRYVPAPHTILSGFMKLKPGHYLRFKQSNPSFEQIPYFSWDPHASEISPNSENYNTVVNGTLKLLVKSLESRLMADVPLGFFLSGGVDSTLCAALIRKFMGKEVNTYTIGFKGDSNSEHLVSEQTAKIIGSKHVVKIFEPSELMSNSIELIAKLDEPNGDRSCVPTFLLCKHASTEVKVALGGDGGDELFSGYSRYPGLNQRIGNGKFYNSKESLKAYLSFGLPVFGFSVFRIFEKNFSHSFLSSLSANMFGPANIEQSIRFVDFNSYLPGAVLSKVDRMSMQASLEVRTPFFSPELLDFSSRLPHQFLYRGKEMKPVLRDICRYLGLEHVANLPKKGFGMPAEFLSHSKDELVKRTGLALKKLDGNPIVNSGIHNLGSKLAPFAGANMNSLWATIVLGEWFESLQINYVD
ncbi:asparagine synthase (glutamine-hydrolyzing) [Betaproteobacteria bacterium]|nr:asparagine synthase (glutamine-hydrolyzing) [Betaproteobacteria bacterium]